MNAGVTVNFGPFCSKDFSSDVNSFLERLTIYLSWIPQVVEEVAVMLKVLVVLEVIIEVIVEALQIRLLNFLSRCFVL